MAVFCLCAAGARGATLTVNTTADSLDVSASCSSGTCSLRDAIAQANPGDTIEFSVTGTITLLSSQGPLDIENDLTIQGPGANLLTVSGGNAMRVLVIGSSSTPTVDISGVTIADGNMNGDGGGIYVAAGTVKFTGCTFSGNAAADSGGGIDLLSGSLTVTGSTFSSNTGASGGAIYLVSGTLTLSDSTFSGNSATAGGAIFNQGTVTATNNTFSGNTATSGAGGAIDNAGTVTAGNSIFAGNSAKLGAGIYNNPSDTVNAAYTVDYKNLAAGSEDDCNGCTSNTNVTSATSNPLALPLGWYGGATETFLPLPTSVAICAGLASKATAANLGADQRGFAMFPTYSQCAATAVDAGAVQTNYVKVQAGGDGGAGDGDCPGTSCTLRDSVDLANSNGYGDIDFGSGISPINLSNANGTLELEATTGINIVGSGANQLTINGGGASSNFSVVTVDSGVTALLYGLTISDGNTTNPGGGITNSGTLTVLESALSGNTVGGGNPGGGINNVGALTIADSTITGNSASGDGGGLANQSGGTVTITESTIAGNTAAVSGSGVGGGIVNAGSTITLIGSTVTGNSLVCTSGPCGGIAGGGILLFGGSPMTLANSIVAGNSVSCSGCGADFADINGSYTDDGGNLASTNSSSTSTINPQLGPLQLSGGATVQTLVPLPGSPAICAGLAANIPAGVATDERGKPDTNTTYPGYSSAAPCVDAGSVQTDYAVSFTTSPPSSVTVDQGFGAAVTLNESGAAFSAGSVNIPITLSSGTLAGVTTEATSAGVATYSALSATLGSDLNLSATVSLNPALTTPLSLSAASADFSVTQAPTKATISASTTSSTVDDSVTLTSVVSPNVTNPVSAASTIPMTGSVTFANNGTALTCSTTTFNYSSGAATATCVTSALPAGSDSKITASYSGDTSYLASPSSADAPAITVAKAATTTAVSANPSSPTLDQSVTFTALVTFPATLGVLPGSTDTVSFSDNGTNITNCGTGNPTIAATATANVYQATCQLASLSGGSHEIVAQYNADSNYTTSTGNLSFSIGTATSTTSVSSSAPSSPINASVTFTAQVALPSGTITPSGTVAFSYTPSGSSTPVSISCSPATALTLTSTSGGTATYSATCATTTLAIGMYTITAAYPGDSNFQGSSGSTSQAIVQGTPTTAINAELTPSTVDQTVGFQATVTAAPAGSVSPTGAVNFTDTVNGTTTPLCSDVSLKNGVYSCAASGLIQGTHTVTADYLGDSNFKASSSSTPQVVNLAPSSLLLSPTATTVSANKVNTVTFTATVVPSSGPIFATGNVTFTDTSGTTQTMLCTTAVSATGVATCTPTALPSGANTIQASYAGDSNFAAVAAGAGPTASVAVQDFGLALAGPASVNGVQVVSVTAGSTNSNDLFTPVAISVTPSSISAYSGTVTLSCTSPSTGAPKCTFPASLSVASGGAQQAGSIGIDATSASPGSYTFTLTGTDSSTGLTHALTFTVVVRAMAGPLSLVSGATTGNTANVSFVLPAGVSLSSLECLYVVGTGITSQNVPPSAVSVGCTFNPATIASSATLQTGTTVVTVSTSGTTTTGSLDRHSSLLFAGLFGLPLFGLLGFGRGRRSMRAIALRLVALLALTAAAYQVMGCGGSFQRPPVTNGQTPAGQYFLLIQGTGTPGNGAYQAVLELNVSL